MQSIPMSVCVCVCAVSQGRGDGKNGHALRSNNLYGPANVKDFGLEGGGGRCSLQFVRPLVC